MTANQKIALANAAHYIRLAQDATNPANAQYWAAKAAFYAAQAVR